MGVQLALRSTGAMAFTDSTGVATVRGLAARRDAILVRTIGHAPILHAVQLHDGDTTRVELAMRPVPTELPTVTVQATRRRELDRAGFYERQRLGFGAFITSEQIEHVAVSRTREVLRLAHRFAVSDRGIGVNTGGAGCRGVRTYIDGVYAPEWESGRSSAHRAAPSVAGAPTPVAIEQVRPDQIAGMEAYTNLEIPPQYMATNPCGVILVWLKHDGDRQ